MRRETTGMVRWRVQTDCGTIETMAVSVGKAVRNARYRLIMGDRCYRRPRPGDLAAMRDVEVFQVERIQAQ